MSQKKLVIIFISCFTFYITPLAAQQNKNVESDDEIQQKLENTTETISQNTTSDVDVDYTTLLDQLNFYREHPLNLNTAGREELESIVFLNELQISALLIHIEMFGKLISPEEFQSIDGFDLQTIYEILPFVKVNDNDPIQELTFKELFSKGKSAFVVRFQKVLEEQKGFSPANEAAGDTHRYLGSAAKIYTRYRSSFNNRISIGVTGEKDAGEEFFKGSEKQGFDFYSAHLFYHGKGWLKSLALGDFQTQYGQGLILWSGLAFSKSSDVMNIKKNALGILPYTSVDENLFMRGGAVSLVHRHIQLDLFYSNHTIDGTLKASNDTLTKEEIISSLNEGGFHRDSVELSAKHTIQETMTGAHVFYRSRRLSIGVTDYSTLFSKRLEKKTQPYNRFDFSGNHNNNIGVDYNFYLRNINFFGETAESWNGGIATLNGLLASLDENLAVSILHRHYDKNYQALESNAFAENSNVANEDGLYFGMQLKPVRGFTLNAYFDQFEFPWLRYLDDAPASGKEYFTQLTYTPSKKLLAYFRIRQINKPKNITADTHFTNLQNEVEQINYRFHVNCQITPSVSLSNRIEFCTLQKGDQIPERGFMMFVSLNYQPVRSRFGFSACYVLFDTDSYNTRIYAFENDVLGAYSIPSCYYRGNRFYTLLHFRMTRGIDTSLRYETTVYDNQKTIGSGLDEINGNRKSEVKVQARFRF